MKHVITFEESDLLQYIKDMLAMRGVAPEGELQITPVEELVGQGRDNEMITITRYQVNVTCRERDPLTHCPMCKHALIEIQEIPTTVAYAPEPTNAVSEPVGHAENIILDESLGETLEPPVSSTKTAARDESASFASIRAQSDRVRREREPHLPKRPRGVKA